MAFVEDEQTKVCHTDMLHHWRSWGKKIWKPENNQKVYIQPTTNEGRISLVAWNWCPNSDDISLASYPLIHIDLQTGP